MFFFGTHENLKNLGNPEVNWLPDSPGFFQIWKRVLISWGFSALQKVICFFRNSEATHVHCSPVAQPDKSNSSTIQGDKGVEDGFLFNGFFFNPLMFKGNGVLYDSGCLLSRLSDFCFIFSEYSSFQLVFPFQTLRFLDELCHARYESRHRWMRHTHTHTHTHTHICTHAHAHAHTHTYEWGTLYTFFLSFFLCGRKPDWVIHKCLGHVTRVKVESNLKFNCHAYVTSVRRTCSTTARIITRIAGFFYSETSH